MDQRAVERILLVLIWLTTGVQVAFSQDAILSVGSEPWISTTAISDSSNSTEQQQTNNELTTHSMLSSSSTATDAATSSSSNNNENDNDTRTYSSTAAAAAISIGSNTTDAPSSAVASSSNGSSDAASNSPVTYSASSTTTTTTYATDSLANANIYMADSQNSTTTERESNAIDAESNGETHDNRTGSGTEGSSWSSGTTQEGGNGVDDRNNGVVEAGVSSKEQDAFPGDTGSWNNSTVAISDNSDTTTQQQTNNEMTTTLQMLGSETEVAMATGNSSNSNEAILSRPTEDYDVFASTPSSSSSPAAAAGGDGGGAAANFSGSDAASNIPTSNASFSTEAFTNANTPASVPNSTTTEPDSNATDSASDAQNHDNATAFGTDGYNWSSATTQGRGGGGGDGGDGVAATGAQVSLGAEDPSEVDQGSWSSTTGNSNSTVQQQTNSEIMTTAAQMLGIGAESNISGTAAATTDITLSSTSAAAGPAVADTPPLSASSDALNQSNYFTNANTLASVPNPTTTEPDSNATDSASDAQNHDNATAFGTDDYNWNSATKQGRGGGDGDDGVVTTGVGVALGAENPFPGETGSWNSTTAIFASDDNTTLHPGEALPAAPIDNNTVATTPASSTNDTFASSPPPPPPPPSSAPSTANSSDAAQNFSTDGALYTSYTTGYFTNANSSNSLETATVPNTMVNASEVQLNGSDFGTDNYNWSSVTEQSSGSADGGGGGGGGNWSNSSVSVTSNSTAENQTADITTTSSSSSSSSYRTILCYNCSGNNCSETDNDTATCASSTGTCYIQYDAVATALSFSCAPLLSSGNGCPGAYATRAARTVCEMCCTAPFCNSKSSSEMEQMCSQQLRSSVDPIGGGGGGGRGRVYQLALAALIAAIHYCTFGTASCFFGVW